ncbi:DUF4440 domain-containing protein [Nocardia abscessus]|uniref:DUF4440 domain-containing protein n=1 Tax=Nocardia abscessus TaxID=120957 RepID=UPI001895760B|nr:DUF4440 domain-containing protein [Nocardia abscessus]MBF6335883.1 DUF4440 domain-containing protein [Nocardia abscessus]
MGVDLVDAVERLHADLATWLGSPAQAEVFERFAAAQHERFSMVTTGGEVLGRSALITSVRGARNAVPGLSIDVSDVEELLRSGGIAVVRFLETHRAAGNVTRRRVTAVLTTDDPEGVRWLTVHETEDAPG